MPVFTSIELRLKGWDRDIGNFVIRIVNNTDSKCERELIEPQA